MGWIKALAIGVAVFVAIGIFSALLHLFYLIIVAIAVGAVVALVLKARARLRAGRQEKTKKVESGQAGAALAQRQLESRAQVSQALQSQQDIEDELARLRSEIE
jgi:hypothetical protein